MKLDGLRQHRGEVLWWELCALLHDIGKLSRAFLEYRQRWHREKGGYLEKDPHEHEWLDSEHERLLREKFPKLNALFREPLKPWSETVASGQLTVINAVHNHIRNEKREELVELLRMGDRTDSRYDRNYPLFGCEQTGYGVAELPPMYRSNVFGYESERTRVRAEILEQAREELYRELEGRLRRFGAASWGEYREIRRVLKRYFEPAMSDTTRPNNDTSLWEHVYSVASISKALHLQRIWDGKEVKKTRFRVWGFGFDALRYLSYSHKIGDILARKEILESIFDWGQEELEFDIPLGNCVYRDSGNVLFLVPDLIPTDELEEGIVEASLRKSGDELTPRFTVSESTERLTVIVTCLEELRQGMATPDGKHAGKRIERFPREGWAGKSICAVCRWRPVRSEQENRLICGECLERRRHRTRTFALEEGAEETPMVREVADKNGRVALVVVKFGLRDWLDGSMVRTIWITQPDAIRRTIKGLEDIADLKDDAGYWKKRLGERRWDWSQIVGDIEDCWEERDKDAPLFLYWRPVEPVAQGIKLRRGFRVDGRSVRDAWEEEWQRGVDEHAGLRAMPKHEALANLLCSKTPTPSTVLDVWETTLEFLQGVTQAREWYGDGSDGRVFASQKSIVEEVGLGVKERWYVEVDEEPKGLHTRETCEAKVGGQECDVVYEGSERRFWIVGAEPSEGDDWRDQTLEITPEGDRPPQKLRIRKANPKERAYYPYRRIVEGPDLLLLLVPADRAVEITRKIHKRYRKEFGKAYGRLPLCVGNIFFAQHLPMFSALDAARRMEGNFRRLAVGAWVRGELRVPERLELKLGTGEEDWHHPYVRTKEALKDRASYAETPVGPVVRLEELGNAEVLYRPNIYDYEFLGASADRFEIHLKAGWEAMGEDVEEAKFREAVKRGKGLHAGPVLLEELDEMAGIWKLLRKARVTDGGVRNLEHLLVSREEAWRRENQQDAMAELKKLAESLVARYRGLWEDESRRERILAAIANGLLFRTLDLYLRILKRRLEGEEEGEGDGDNGGESRKDVLAEAVSG